MQGGKGSLERVEECNFGQWNSLRENKSGRFHSVWGRECIGQTDGSMRLSSRNDRATGEGKE